MARCPHDVFKLILPFKDPRYERVRNGDPYMVTSTRVWYTYSEFEEAQRLDPPWCTWTFDNMQSSEWVDSIPHNAPALLRNGPDILRMGARFDPGHSRLKTSTRYMVSNPQCAWLF